MIPDFVVGLVIALLGVAGVVGASAECRYWRRERRRFFGEPRAELPPARVVDRERGER